MWFAQPWSQLMPIAASSRTMGQTDGVGRPVVVEVHRQAVVDRDHLAGALTFREKDGKTYLYLKSVYEAERVIETQMRTLVSRPDIKLASPVTAQHWHTYLFDAGSPLAERSPDDYEAAIQGQVQVCQGVYVPVGSKAERDDIKSQIAASLRHAEPQG